MRKEYCATVIPARYVTMAQRVSKLGSGYMTYMHHLVNSMSKLCHSGGHNNISWKSIPMFYRSGGKALHIVIGRRRYVSVCQRVDEFGLPAVRYDIFKNRNSNMVIRDLVHHDYSGRVSRCL